MAVDTKKLFNEDLPAAMQRNPEAAKEIGAKYQLNITGAGSWFIDVSATGPKIEAGEPGGAECTLTLTDDDFQVLQANPQAEGMKLYMSGKLKVQGNPMLAMKLQKLFALALFSFLVNRCRPRVASRAQGRCAASVRPREKDLAVMRPLEGLRVLDLSRLIPGPFASLVLADMGAQVDKVEDPSGGDYLRHMPPQIAGSSGAFHALNRGKRSLVLDLKQPAGRDALLRMLPRYDVLLEQFRPGVLDRLGVGHALLRERFPRLIICALTGYGQRGPLAQRAGHDLNYLARAGVLGMQGPTSGPPQVPGFQMADVAGGVWSVVAILGALRQRDASGEGALLDVAMVDGALGFASAALGGLFAGQAPARGDEALTGGIAPYSTYETSDGGAMSLAALEPKFWLAFCAATGFEADMTALMPGDHQPALRARLAALFKTRTRAAWEQLAAAHDCCLEPVLTPEELRADPHLAARELFFDLDVEGTAVGQFRTPVSPPADALRQQPPTSGQHSDVILREAGLGDDEIAALRASGVVR